MTELQFAMGLVKRGPRPWTCNQAEDFAVLHAAQIMDVSDPDEAMRARKDDLLARCALNLLKRAMQPGIHHAKRAKKERRTVVKRGEEMRGPQKGEARP